MSSNLYPNNISQPAISETNSADENFMKNGKSTLVLYYVSGMNKDHILALIANGGKKEGGETVTFSASKLMFIKESALIMIFECHYH